MPGTDIREVVKASVDATPELLFLPELPARGPGADLTGRTLGLLPDFPGQWGPTGWALTDRPGRDIRRAQSFLRQDLDTFEEATQGYAGPLKVQLAGPWTLAATVELRSGRAVVADSGARRDLAQALGAALDEHLAELRRRFPLATLVVQLDEPGLPSVLRGSIPSPSGWGRLAAIEEPEVERGLATVLAGLPSDTFSIAHCCAAEPAVRLLRAAGFRGLSLDATLLTEADDEALGEAVEAGLGLLLGVVPAVGGLPPSKVAAAPVRALWSRLGQDPGRLGEQVVATPTCGLAGATPVGALAALRACVEVGRLLVEDPEGERG